MLVILRVRVTRNGLYLLIISQQCIQTVNRYHYGVMEKTHPSTKMMKHACKKRKKSKDKNSTKGADASGKYTHIHVAS